MKSRDTIFGILLAFCFIVFARLNKAIAQEPAKYSRKSITYVDALLSTKNLKMKSSDQQYILNTIQTGIRIARFDYNPLPANLQNTFRQKLTTSGYISEDELESQINSSLVPEIVRVLDLNKEIRAQNLITETQQNSFITLKAKELGITAEQLEQVMNSSYLFIPFIDSYSEKTDKDKSEVSIRITGGLLWYHILSDDQPRVEKIAKISADASSSVSTDDHYTLDGQRVDARDYAFRTAAHTLALNLEIKTRELDMFKLKAPIAEIERRRIKFPLGKAEGIKLDEPFFVGEWIEREEGRIRFQKSGFVRISTVSDNRKSPGQLSQAYAIKKGDWARGMMVIEHPRLGVDVVLKPRMVRIDIERGGFFAGGDDKAFAVAFDKYHGHIPILDLALNWNIANLTKKRQSFLVIGGSGGFVPVKNYVGTEEEIFNLWGLIQITETNIKENIFATYFSGYIGYLKKYYLGSFALHWEAMVGGQGLSASGKFASEDISIVNGSAGGRLTLGLEYAVNIDCNVGVVAGYSFFPSINYWYVKYADKEEDIATWNTQHYPRISSIGHSLGFYIHFSPPTLPFNPVAASQSQMKNVKDLK